MRNYKKEREWQVKKYDQITANIDKGLANELRIKLKEKNLTIAEWVRQNAVKFIKS